MKKSTAIIITIVLSIVYISTYMISAKFRVKEALPNKILVFLPNCPQDFTPLTIVDQDTDLCINHLGIFVHSKSKTQKIFSWKENSEPAFIGAYKSIVVLQQSTSLIVYELTDEIMKKIYTLELTPNQSVIHMNSFGNINGTTLFLSIFQEVQNADSKKSKLQSITINGAEITKTASIELLNMEKVKSISSKQELIILYTEPMYDFITPTFSTISWGENPAIITSSDKVIEIPKEKNDIDIVTEDNTTIIKHEESEYKLVNSPSKSFEWNIVGESSTRIQKRVYNCKDFGESIEISLRICTLENEHIFE